MKNFIWLTLAMLIFSCKGRNESTTESILQIPVITVEYTDTIYKSSFVAEIQAIKNVEIRARLRGFLETIMVDEGKEVKKGQTLFNLSSPEYTAGLTKAEASLERALSEEKAVTLEVDRVRMLVEKNVIANSELAITESKAQVAKAVISEAQAALLNAKTFVAYTKILAPFDGVINRIPLKPGSLVNEGDLLTSISDITNVFAYFHLSEADYLHYQKAKRGKNAQPEINNVELYLADGSEYKYKGIIETVAGEIDAATGSIAFRARFVNPEKMLKHGASGTVKLTNIIQGVILIPQKSILEIQDKNYVFKVDQNNKVKMHSVILGKRIGLYYIVTSGLYQSDKIAIEGVQSLKDGNIIIPIN